MRTTEMVLCAHYLKTSKFIPVCISIYILSLAVYNFETHWELKSQILDSQKLQQ